MSREQYLAELKNELNIMNYDNVDGALEYYSDKFDQAAKSEIDEQEVISELGKPGELAKVVENDLDLYRQFLFTYFF